MQATSEGLALKNTSSTSISSALGNVADVEDAMQGKSRLSAIEKCPECDCFSLSEIVLCKGSNIPAHKGRWYQIVSVIGLRNNF